MYADQILDGGPAADSIVRHQPLLSHRGGRARSSRRAGIYRVHQFTKVEMFAFTLPDQSDAMHEELCQMECEIFDDLGIPYRVVDTATGDLGGPAYRKFDLEAWMPGRGEWGEMTSTSTAPTIRPGG